MNASACLRHSLLIVEGAHDAAFFGVLLEQKGFQRSRRLKAVPGDWWKLFPTRYPFIEAGLLDRVVPGPDIFCDQRGRCIGLIAAGGDCAVVNELENAIDILRLGYFEGIGIAIDADEEAPDRRFLWICSKLETLNQKKRVDDPNWRPLPRPTAVGRVAGEHPKLIVHIFPDNQGPGRLETVLIDCARHSHPAVVKAADSLLNELLSNNPALKDRSVGKIRSNSAGREKAHVRIIANVVSPGGSLAVSIRDGFWLENAALSTESVRIADRFLDALLPTVSDSGEPI